MPASEDQGKPFLVTGFEPFGGRSRNRSWQVVERLQGRPGLQILQLPVDFARLQAEIPRLMQAQPRGLLLLGESPAERPCVEQLAVNIVDSEAPDNAGLAPRMAAVVEGGPAELRASWDAQRVARRLGE